MRTKAWFMGHPVHPMLIGFPITFLSAALVLDAAGMIADRPAWWTVGAWSAAAGVISGLVAAAPGIVDYLGAVPPGSSAKKRATYHMVVNVTALVLFVIGWWIRGEAAARPGWVVVALELAANGLMSVGGYMGGTLVYRNMMGVDHRYAEKTKWSEQTVKAAAGEMVEVCEAGELKPDQMRLLHVNGQRIVLANTGEGYCAFQDRCTHRGASLADGVLICGRVQCLWHGSRFDVKSGECERGPAEEGLKTYAVEERNGKVWLRTPGDGNG
jgi:nitrite reductase/ring-hydroxylating ferredoxin subunit/uncharacterized membrane protein